MRASFPLLFLVALLTVSANAAVLGQQFPVSDIETAEAAYDQGDPEVASNGATVFAIWRDERGTRDDKPGRQLFGSRIDGDGSFHDPFGILLGSDVYAARIGSDGTGFLLITSGYDGITAAQRISDEGKNLGPAFLIPGAFIAGLASNGNGYLALLSNAAGETYEVAVLSASGQVQRRTALPNLRGARLIANGARYAIVDQKWTCDGTTPCIVDVRLTLVDPATLAASEAIVMPNVPQHVRVDTVSTSAGILVAAVGDAAAGNGSAQRTVSIAATDRAGTIIAAPKQISAMPASCICGYARPSLAYDGNEVLVAWPQWRIVNGVETEAQVVGLRFAPTGELLDSTPMVVFPTYAVDFAAAATRAGVVLVASGARRAMALDSQSAELYARTAPSLASLRAGEGTEDVVESAAAQTDPAVAVSGTRAIAVWREFDQPSAVAAAWIDLNDASPAKPTTLAPRGTVRRDGISVAVLGDTALAAWREDEPGRFRILASRISRTSRVADPNPIVLYEGATTLTTSGWTSIATDGAQFFVVWSADQDVLGARVLRDGTVLDATPIKVSGQTDLPVRLTPRVAWTGTVFLVVWADDATPPGILFPVPPQTIVRAARVTSAGAVLDAAGGLLLHSGPGPLAETAVASNGHAAVVVWSGNADAAPLAAQRCMHALPFDGNGAPLAQTASEFGCDSAAATFGTKHIAVARAGQGFIATWTTNDVRSVMAAALSEQAGPREIITVTDDVESAFGAAVADSPLGTLFVYSRVSPEKEYGGVARLFGRFLLQARRTRALR